MNTGTQIELGVGPMSPEIVEAVFRYSNFFRKPLMLIASKNQIDYNGGYVNGWNTSEYMSFVNDLKEQNPNADVKVCRDHCGPGFNGVFDLSDSHKTIEEDIKNGFDLMHIDFCHFQGSQEDQLKATREAVELCQKLNPSIQIEIGTDENTGANYSFSNIAELEKEIDFFQEFCSPEFYVIQTGSLVKEIEQVGSFNEDFVRKVSETIKSKGLKLKEHNADYLSKEEISRRKGIVDAQNIAPQLGVIQTNIILNKCLTYGISFDEFANVVYEGGKWKKWMHNNTPENKMLCVLIAGHYHFSDPTYTKIYEELEKREDIKESIIDHMQELIGHYVG